MRISGGWTGRILRVDLERGKHSVQDLSPKVAVELLGGRGFAAKILWDELEKGTDPLSPENRLIFATGPLTGLLLPSSGKLVVAAKSPLTGGYGDGNIGTKAAVQLKKAGYDLVVVQGRAPQPSVLVIEDEDVRLEGAGDLWGKSAEEVQDVLEEKYPGAGILTIGQGGERLIKFAVITSEHGRAGGRPGIGAVMGSKNLKAVVIRGTKEIPAARRDELLELGRQGYLAVRDADAYAFWMRQGTMMTVEWCQKNGTLPTFNFREGVFDGWEGISGATMEREFKVAQKGCPNCNMVCGMVNEIKGGPYVGRRTELDYENAAMLGSNLGIDDMNWVLTLNLFADEQGIDTISMGSVLAFVTEAYELGMISDAKLEGIRPRWGDGEAMLRLAEMLAERRGFGDAMAEGTAKLAKGLGPEAEKFAMHVKGLEISAYDCHTLPGMALAYGTSPIGAHHKDAWFIAWELKMGREVVSREKVESLIEMQRIRGGFFEAAVTCRLPWIELGFDLEWYEKYLHAATGLEFKWDDLKRIADRIYNLVRGLWVRENPSWDRSMDYPPDRWFEHPLTVGPYAGQKLDRGIYDRLLSYYYEIRGWDERGIPRKSTLRDFGLDYVIEGLERAGVSLSE